jgi:putative tryptophan/tyrosine transport system substrate-binding protein
MRKKHFITIFTLIALVSIAFTAKMIKENGNKRRQQEQTIAIIQSANNPSLHDVKIGLIHTLDLCCKYYRIYWKSARNNPETAEQILSEISELKPVLLITIGTLATQTAYSKVDNIPIVFGAVTDPTKTILESIKKHNKKSNITGISDNPDTEKQLELFQQMLPKTKIIGMMYDQNSQDSTLLVNKAKQAAEKLGIVIHALPISNKSDIKKTALAISKVSDLVFIQKDSLLEEHISTIAQAANQLNIPVVCTDLNGTYRGAMAAIGIDEREIGRETGKIAAKILEQGTELENIPIDYPDKLIVQVNAKKIIKFDAITKDISDIILIKNQPE